MKFAVLNQRNEAYASSVDTWHELDDLYKGGYAVTRKAEKYLPALVGEHEMRANERRRSAGYIGYLGMIIDRFVAALFMTDLSVTEPGDSANPGTLGGTAEAAFWTDFAKNADLGGTSFPQMMRAMMRGALLKQKAIFAIDFPAPGAVEEGPPSPSTMAEEDALGVARGYLVEVPPEQLIDWKVDRFGNFEWAILYRIIQDRATPTDMRSSTKVHEFKVWTLAGGVAVWEIFRYVEEKGRAPTDDTDFDSVAGAPTSFTRIPLIQVELPHGLWVGNIVGSLQREHHQRRACLVSSMNRSLVAIPYVKLGPEIGAAGGPMPAEAAQNPARGNDPVQRFMDRGYLVLGQSDDLGFAEPSGSAYTVTREDLSDLKDEMFRVVHQMAASLQATQSSQGASGDSKREDREAECVVLTALGAVVRDTAKMIYDAIATARKENVEWVVHGLDRFESDDRTLLLQEATQLDMVNIPSPTFKKAHKTRTALKVLESASPAEQETIRLEIDKGVDAEVEMDAVRRDAEKKQLQNPQMLGGAGAPITKKPPAKA